MTFLIYTWGKTLRSLLTFACFLCVPTGWADQSDIPSSSPESSPYSPPVLKSLCAKIWTQQRRYSGSKSVFNDKETVLSAYVELSQSLGAVVFDVDLNESGFSDLRRTDSNDGRATFIVFDASTEERLEHALKVLFPDADGDLASASGAKRIDISHASLPKQVIKLGGSVAATISLTAVTVIAAAGGYLVAINDTIGMSNVTRAYGVGAALTMSAIAGRIGLEFARGMISKLVGLVNRRRQVSNPHQFSATYRSIEETINRHVEEPTFSGERKYAEIFWVAALDSMDPMVTYLERRRPYFRKKFSDLGEVKQVEGVND